MKAQKAPPQVVRLYKKGDQNGRTKVQRRISANYRLRNFKNTLTHFQLICRFLADVRLMLHQHCKA